MTPKHDSIRGWFAAALYYEMYRNDKVWLLTADLGYGMWDDVRNDFPDRFLNCGASEQLLVGAGVGLALSGKIPFCYSITTFLIYRAFEWHRNYLNHEKIPVYLIGSGYGDDYKHDGITHQPHEIHKVMSIFENIREYYPTTKEEVPELLRSMIMRNTPAFMCLRR